MYDLVVVGGGPAGLTAASYALARRMEMLLVTPDLGGKAGNHMRVRGLDGYETLDGEETVRRFRERAALLDFGRVENAAEAVEPVPGGRAWERFRVRCRGGAEYLARSVILATGARPRALGVPGEAELSGRGVTYSATSHAPLFWGREVVVAGSGRDAERSASEVARIAARVWVVTDAWPDTPLARAVASCDAVTLLEGFSLLEVVGEQYVDEVVVRSPDGDVGRLSVEGVFVAMGIEPNTEAFAGLVDLDDRGQVRVDARGRTSRAGVFAAGDVTDSYSEQVLIAIGDGARAALAAYDYLAGCPRQEDEPLPTQPAPRAEQDW